MTSDRESALVTATALAAECATDAPPLLLDVRWVVGSPPLHADYLAAHIPGALFVDLDADLADPPSARGRHPLPDPTRLERRLREFGVTADSPIVAYDGNTSVAAARAWWVLRWAGLTDVRVLDGGFAAWAEHELPTASGEQQAPGGGTVTVRPGSIPALSAEQAAELAGQGRLLDARAPERFRGESEPIDPIAGRIPGAVNLPATDLVNASGRFKPARTVADMVETAIGEDGQHRQGAGEAPLGVYCGSGVTAAQGVLALHEAGLDAVLYPGSWSEWITDPGREVATGPA